MKIRFLILLLFSLHLACSQFRTYLDHTKMTLPSLPKSADSENVSVIPQMTPSEDFSYFGLKIHGVFFFVGGFTKGKDKHQVRTLSMDFVKGRKALKTGINAGFNPVLDEMEINRK